MFKPISTPPELLERLRGRYTTPTVRVAAPEEADAPVDDNGIPNGCMVAFYPNPDLAQSLLQPGGEPLDELHVTLAYLGKDLDAGAVDTVKSVVERFAKAHSQVDGEISGVGVFTAGEAPVTVALVDCPSLPAFRQNLVDALTAAGVPPMQNHGYMPHITLAYDDVLSNRAIIIENAQLDFGIIWVAAGTDRFGYTLDGPAPAAPEASAVKQVPPAGFDAETEIIKMNIKHPSASKRHPFRPAQFAMPDGSPRCLMCGKSPPPAGACNPDAPSTTYLTGPTVTPIAAADEADAAKIAAGIDAGVDQALVLLRSTPDLPPYGAQARDVLQGIEPACDALLDYFGVSDPDDVGPESAAAEPITMANGTYPISDRKSARSAWILRGHSATYSEAEVVAHIRQACQKLGLQFPGDAHERAYTELRTPKVQLARPSWLPDTKAFVEEINGKTILTTQAAAELAGAMTNHEHYLWTQGRLVGADEPNRNGAYWTSGDLELGQTTVPYGPLNWLHEEKHVIGTIAAASYSTPGQEMAADTTQNHIAIAAPIWRWLYPDEASVVEMASDAGKFWYSMECISKAVQCVGDGGCGAEVSYLDYMQKAAGVCEHMIQRSAVRRLVDPIFLGAAVIIPPVRPGWVDADASVARQAASLAEKAYDAAGRPDMSASEWERLMAQVVKFATS